jgi:Na+/melibiose symporter-like transporter
MGWLIGLILCVLGISLFFDVYFWLKNRYQQAEQDRMEEEMVNRIESISATFSEFRTDVDTALTNRRANKSTL